MKAKNKSLINTRKLFYVPIIYIFVIILTLGLFSIQFSISITREKVISDGIIIAQQIADKVSSNQAAKRLLVESFEAKNSEVGAYILSNRTLLNNDFLHSISESFNVDEIWFYSPEGEVIYSANNSYIGWKAQEGDPIYSFMNSGLTYFHEEVREGTETGSLFKFSYFKDDDGFFVQVGAHFENYNNVIKLYDLQSIVEAEAAASTIYYVLITDKNLVSVADSDVEDIGADWSDQIEYQLALAGTANADEWFYPQRNEKILEIAVPLYIDGSVIGVLAIGTSLESINNIILLNVTRILIMLLLSGFVLFIIQKQFVLAPLQRLQKNILSIDLTHSFIKKIQINPKDPYLGVNQAFNSLVDNIEHHVNEIEKINSELYYAANYDLVTELKNRRALMEYISNISLGDEQVAFCMLDLDGLKDINDLYGHSVGDLLIKTVAYRLNQFATQFESFRFGGDEFFMIIKGSDSQLMSTLKSVVERVSAPITHNHETISVRCCIGVSFSKRDGITAENLIRKADIAMYIAKAQHEIEIQFYNDSMNDIIQSKENIYKELLIAIEKNSFQLLYQPLISTHNKDIVSLEALLRIKNSLTPPSVFIPIAESKGLISKITYIVIENVLTQIKTWEKQGYDILPISINISPRHFVDKNLLSFLVSKLKQHEVDSKFIELEITEEVLIENMDSVIEFISKYHEIGIRITLDDFGSGYSSLNYLTQISFDKIKLDKKIIDRFLNPDKFKVIKSLIEIAHELDLPIVAEGVELQEQFDILLEVNCNQVQGYLFSQPVDEITIEQKYLKKQRSE